jgi:CheY-like chemotaxis protein
MRKPTLLLVDNIREYCESTADMLRTYGYDVVTASNQEEARVHLENLEQTPIDAAIFDLRLKNDKEESDVTGALLARTARVPALLVTGAPLVPPKALDGMTVVSKHDGFEGLLTAIKRSLVPSVFVAHGHRKKDGVVLFLRQLNLRAETLKDDMAVDVVLRNLEEHVNRAHAAVVVLAADDQGYPQSNPREKKARARQNVLFEWGYLIAKLGLPRVIPLIEEGVELPSNYRGIKSIHLDSVGGWKNKLEGALARTGIDIELYKTRARPWHST